MNNLKRPDHNLATIKDDSSTPADRLLKALDENEDVDYIAMFADGTSDFFTGTSIDGEPIQQATHAVSPDVVEHIQALRQALHVPADCKTLLSVMWVRKQERNLFAARPHALHIDFIANTNAGKCRCF